MGSALPFLFGGPPGARVAGPPGIHTYLETEHLNPGGGWLSQPRTAPCPVLAPGAWEAGIQQGRPSPAGSQASRLHPCLERKGRKPITQQCESAENQVLKTKLHNSKHQGDWGRTPAVTPRPLRQQQLNVGSRTFTGVSGLISGRTLKGTRMRSQQPAGFCM